MAHIKRILVPSDGSPPSLAALCEAAMLADELGGSIDVLEVQGPDRFEVGSALSVSAGTHERAQRDLEQAIEAVKRTLGDRVTRRTERGDPLRTIVDAAAGYDLVVMGTHGRIGRLHSLLGSVAEGVVRNAPCPVLTVREPSGEAESFAERRHGRDSIATESSRR